MLPAIRITCVPSCTVMHARELRAFSRSLIGRTRTATLMFGIEMADTGGAESSGGV